MLVGVSLITQPAQALPPPPVPGNTEWERFDNAVGMLLSAPKQALVKQEKKLKRRREKGGPDRNLPDGSARHADSILSGVAWLAK
ncbi:hypothetical protein SBA3_670018 [Candidatus Sulfopaludibacter sp. SbA3]|nr:hypothetical protein SBA3_670018 [Candidatus Sulfopaludibacter sp. SbA3]